MIKSPYQTIEKIKTDIAIVKLSQELVSIHEKFLSKLDEVSFLINKKVGPKGDKGERGQKGEKGDKGDRGVDGQITNINEVVNIVLSKVKVPRDGIDGIDGKTPIKGVDYMSKDEIDSLKKEIKDSLRQYQDSKDPEQLLHLFTKKGKKLSMKHIDGLEQTISAFSNQLGRGYLHGGGDTVVAGTGVTLTSNSDGTKTISSSITSVGYQAPTGTVDGSNKTFVFASAPNVIVVDGGQPIRKTQSDGSVNWTGTTTVTLSIAPTFDVFGLA